MSNQLTELDKRKVRIFRDRFSGRQDVYARQHISDDGARNFYPVCKNFYAAKCHIKLKDGGTCTSCKIKEYAPVTDDTVIKHVSGQEQQTFYLLLEDSTINFGAVDLDCKPGKEHIGHTFEDVLKVTKVLDEFGVKYGIARSTGKGHHIYMFFEKPIESVIFRAVIGEVFERTGFAEESRQCVRAKPEIFPKQAYAPTDGGVGNGIKCPMIEANWERERNCFVTKENSMIPVEAQWSYLDSIPRNDPELFKKIIADCGIEITESNSPEQRGSGPKRFKAPVVFNERGEFVPRSNASFMKVIEGCSALKRIAEIATSGGDLSHDQGFALFHMAIHTKDGYDWFLKNTNWGKTERDMRQLQQSINKDYAPWTCLRLQEKGVCVPGTKCLEKKPPHGTYRDGVLVEDKDVPMELWPEPSPIRFGMGKGENYLSKLINEAVALSNVTDESVKLKETARIIKEATVFDETQQEALKNALEKSKVFKKAQLNKQFKTANEQKVREETELQRSRSDTIMVNGTIYRRSVNPYGYLVIKPGKNNGELMKPLCNFVIDITECRTKIDECGRKDTTYVGMFRHNSREDDFEISSSAFSNNSEFNAFFARKMGIYWNVMNADLELIRSVSMESALLDLPGKPKTVHTQYYTSQGWYGSTYLMPSVAVDKDGLKPNTEMPVDLRDKGISSDLDFKILGEDTFRETLFHIKRDYFKAYDRSAAMLGLGFTLIGSVTRYLGFYHKPKFWLEGTTGRGKSALCELLSQYWGPITKKATWQSTTNGVYVSAQGFKDAVMLVDDFKAESLGPQSVLSCKNYIQNNYDDGSVRLSLQKDGNLKNAQPTRCIELCNGEETPANEASILSRMTLLNYENLDTDITRPFYEKCEAMKVNYCGITPRFIHYVLNLDKEAIQAQMRTYFDMLRAPIKHGVNPDRISNNTMICLIGFRLFLGMMRQNGIIDDKEFAAFIKEAEDRAINAVKYHSSRCSDEQNSNIFMDILKNLLISGSIKIDGLKGVKPQNNAEVIGQVDSECETRAFLIISESIRVVKKNSPSGNITLYAPGIGRQLKSQNILVKETLEEGRNRTQRRINGVKNSVWHVDLVEMGLIDSIEKTLPFVAKDKPKTDKDGIL